MVLEALILVLLASITHAWINLQDVSVDAGLKYSFGAKTKYGGPSIADLDGNGYQDLLLLHHDSYHMEVYFNLGNGKFSRQTLTWTDAHSLAPFRYQPTDKAMYFSLSQGGARDCRRGRA